MGAAFAGGLAFAAAALSIRGTARGHDGIVLGLLLTARWAYFFFWPAYAGGALATIFGPRFKPLARRGRALGLAFAAAMLVHATLVAWLYVVSPHPPLPLSSALFFGVGLGFVYVLALFSVPALAARVPPRLRRALFTVGMEYIALAFLSDFLHDPFDGSLEHLVAYLPFLALALTAALLRIIAYAKRLHGRPGAPGAARSAS